MANQFDVVFKEVLSPLIERWLFRMLNTQVASLEPLATGLPKTLERTVDFLAKATDAEGNPFSELINSKLMPIDFDVTKDTLFLQGLEKGIEKGIEKGEVQGIEKGRLLERRRQERRRRQEIRRMHAHQIPLDIICEVMNVTPEYVQKVLERKGR